MGPIRKRRSLPRRALRWIGRRLGWQRRRYWKRRRNHAYYRTVVELARQHAGSARTLIDAGGGRGRYLQQFDWIAERTVVDVRVVDRLPGVTYVEQDFLSFTPARRADLVTCLQVLEHLRHPHEFAAHLLECGSVVIVSVPYRWPRGATRGHRQDPIDEEKFRSWFPVEPVSLGVVKDRTKRLVAVFASRP